MLNEQKIDYDLTIVLPTLGRKDEVEAMLDSIYKYVYPTSISFEIIVVDQNFSDLLDSVVKKYCNLGFMITHHKVSFRGLSKAKNYGAKLAKGKYVCFIDDDAEFLPNTIKLAFSELKNESLGAVSGRCVDRNDIDSVVKFSDKDSFLTIKDFEGKFVESTMFFKRTLTEKYQYDENMGVGAFYGSQEGFDIVYRMLSEGVNIKFISNLKFYHPQTVLCHESTAAVRRSFNYRCGYGYLCKKHNFNFRFYSRLIKVILYTLVLVFYRPRRVKFYFAEILGSLVGRFV